MAAANPIILILGAGPNIGQSLGRAFAAKGYRVALAARRDKAADDTADQIHIQSDFSDPGAVANVFAKVKAALGIPSVVVYNGTVEFTLPNLPWRPRRVPC
jgi:NAD(P)-dependent dehydrogenase (short-subunit alcohol dehydrogenase family)